MENEGRRRKKKMTEMNQDKKPSIFKRFGGWFKGLKTWKKVVLIAVLVVLVVGGSVFAFAMNKLNMLERATVDPTELSIVDVDGYTNILLLGVDTRNMKKLDGSRSDAIMVVSINQKTNEVKLVSVFRDTYLKLGDTNTYDKITHACYYGGPEMTVKSINQALDLNISNYVVVNFKAVADLVDAVGGITVDVQPEEIQQLNKYTKQTAHNVGTKKYNLVKKAGEQKLEGVQAVSYGRIRKGVGDDFKRTERMRTVLTLVFEQMKTLNVKELNDIANMMLPQCKTTLSNSDILALSLRLTKYNITDSIGFPYDRSGGMIDGVSYVFPAGLAGNTVQLHKDMFGQENYQVSSICNTISSEITSRIAASKVKVTKKDTTKKDTTKKDTTKKDTTKKDNTNKTTEEESPDDNEDSDDDTEGGATE